MVLMCYSAVMARYLKERFFKTITGKDRHGRKQTWHEGDRVQIIVNGRPVTDTLKKCFMQYYPWGSGFVTGSLPERAPACLMANHSWADTRMMVKAKKK